MKQKDYVRYELAAFFGLLVFLLLMILLVGMVHGAEKIKAPEPRKVETYIVVESIDCMSKIVIGFQVDNTLNNNCNGLVDIQHLTVKQDLVTTKGINIPYGQGVAKTQYFSPGQKYSLEMRSHNRGVLQLMNIVIYMDGKLIFQRGLQTARIKVEWVVPERKKETTK